jgi:hypothetical protein
VEKSAKVTESSVGQQSASEEARLLPQVPQQNVVTSILPTRTETLSSPGLKEEPQPKSQVSNIKRESAALQNTKESALSSTATSPLLVPPPSKNSKRALRKRKAKESGSSETKEPQEKPVLPPDTGVPSESTSKSTTPQSSSPKGKEKEVKKPTVKPGSKKDDLKETLLNAMRLLSQQECQELLEQYGTQSKSSISVFRKDTGAVSSMVKVDSVPTKK